MGLSQLLLKHKPYDRITNDDINTFFLSASLNVFGESLLFVLRVCMGWRVDRE